MPAADCLCREPSRHLLAGRDRAPYGTPDEHASDSISDQVLDQMWHSSASGNNSDPAWWIGAHLKKTGVTSISMAERQTVQDGYVLCEPSDCTSCQEVMDELHDVHSCITHINIRLTAMSGGQGWMVTAMRR